MSEFEKSRPMTPQIVRLYDSHKLYELVKDKTPLARAELASAVTELFESGLSEREQDLLADVLIGLMRQAEKDLRQALSERLAKLDNVPLRLILHLANDDISVAAPVLCKSLALNDLDLIYIIKSQGADYWRLIASRDVMSGEVVDVLADTRDLDTALVLTQNERIVLTRHAMIIFSDMARENGALAKPLLMRPEIPADLARRMYDYVGQELKTYIMAFFGEADSRAGAAVDSLVVEFAEASPSSEFMPTGELIKSVREKAALGLLNMGTMMETLQKGDIASFIAQFSEYTGVSAQKIHDFLRQECPKGMAIACRAFRVQKNDFSRIYLLTHRMRSKQRLVNHKDMLELLRYFDKVRPEVAARIVGRSTTGRA